MPIYQPPPDAETELEIRLPSNEHTCLQCGSRAVLTISDYYDYGWHGRNRGRRCRSCFTEWTICDRDDHNETMVQTRRDVNACMYCLTRNGYRACGDCARYATYLNSVSDEVRRIHRVCDNCVATNYAECFGCGSYHHESSMVDVQGNHGEDDQYCPECQESILIRCSACDELRRRHTVCRCGNAEGMCNCNSCRTERSREERRISVAYVNEWNYRPSPLFKGDGELFLGMELEVETGQYWDHSLAVIEKHTSTDLLYLKQDGSINAGFEIVTHPMSYQWASENFPWEMLTELDNVGAYTHDRVGIHIHISRKGFDGPAHIFKWMKFVYRNSDRVTTVAGREAYDWAAFDPDDRTNIKHFCKGKGRSDSRYRAINVANRETFEVRVFRSSLNPHEVKAYLGFADASVRYTQELTCSSILQGGWEWSAFYAWLADKPEYIDLRTRMEELSCVS